MVQTKDTITLEQWPTHYYDITDINQRHDILLKRLEQYPDSAEDQERLHVLIMRFGKAHAKNRPDYFMQALLRMKQLSPNDRHGNEECLTLISQLALTTQQTPILLQEYQNLLEQYIRLTYKSFQRPAFLGMGKRSEETVIANVRLDLEEILITIPSRYHLEQYTQPLYTIAQNILSESIL